MIAWAQGKYVKGYFITSDGKRTEGLIKMASESRRDSPKSFSYKESESGEEKAGDVNNVKELGLASGEVFHRLPVDMDRSPDDIDRINENPQTSQMRNPVFASETLFLRLVVSGKATLYQYDEGNLHRFFYSVGGGAVKQLVYKRYLVRAEGASQLDQRKGDLSVAVNEDYKQEIFNDMKCAEITMKDVERLSYEAKSLKKLFAKYNSCGSK